MKQPGKADTSHYTFGDSDVAATRLRHLAEAFEGSTRALLVRLAPRRPRVVIDLGCGPGHTTQVLRELLDPERLTGVDRSSKLLALARARSIRADFVEHDVTHAPFPGPPADLLYSRFLLTHLNETVDVLTIWANALAPGGVLVLEETASMTSEHPSFRSYYGKVEAMQSHYGQAMYVGRSLGTSCRAAGLAVAHSTTVRLAQPARQMARLHAMNLRTWKDDAYARGAFDARELESLAGSLTSIADGLEVAPPVTCEMTQLVAHR
jgi:trans-aconitate 2-methyltransferase